jgi:uncharacterized membrane protein
MWVRLLIYGLLGWCVEIVWTALSSTASGQQKGWRLAGTTYLWMLPIYGLIAPLYEPVHDAIRACPWLARGLVYGTGIMVVEYATGWTIRAATGSCPWDYTGRSRWHVRGLVRLDYAPLWIAFGLALEPVTHTCDSRRTAAVVRRVAQVC